MSHAEREGFAAFMLRLRGRGMSRQVVAAFEATPRSAFIAEHLEPHAWSDRMLPIDCGEAIEGVDTQAYVIAMLGLEPEHRVLEVGTGSGFTAAVMSRLAARVVTLDHYRTLADHARARLDQFGVTNVVVRQADGAQGLPAESPFERIVVWCAFDSLPKHFLDQLASGGSMIAPIGPEEDRQTLVRLIKVGSRFEREDLGEVRFQPFLRGVAAKL